MIRTFASWQNRERLTHKKIQGKIKEKKDDLNGDFYIACNYNSLAHM